MKNYRKEFCFKWRLEPIGNDQFALMVVKTTDLSVGKIKKFKKLLSDVVKRSGGWKINFNKKADAAFRKWLGDPKQPLPSQAYGRLSNWFLTIKEPERSSPRACAARVMWMEMFCCEPENRLTDPKANGIVLPEPFNLWWKEQQKRQEEC